MDKTAQAASTAINSINDLSWQSVITTLAVIVLFLGLARLVMGVIKDWKSMKQPSTDEHKEIIRRLDKHDECLENVERRLKNDDARISLQKEDNAQLMDAVHGIILHLLTGNSLENLRRLEKGLSTYIANR